MSPRPTRLTDHDLENAIAQIGLEIHRRITDALHASDYAEVKRLTSTASCLHTTEQSLARLKPVSSPS